MTCLRFNTYKIPKTRAKYPRHDGFQKPCGTAERRLTGRIRVDTKVPYEIHESVSQIIPALVGPMWLSTVWPKQRPVSVCIYGCVE